MHPLSTLEVPAPITGACDHIHVRDSANPFAQFRAQAGERHWWQTELACGQGVVLNMPNELTPCCWSDARAVRQNYRDSGIDRAERVEMAAEISDFPICRLVEKHARRLVEAERQSDAHRMDHLHRVARNARSILTFYPEADAEILYLAVLLHDVDQPFNDKENHVMRSAAAAERILTEIDYPPARLARVLQLIREHSTEHIGSIKPSTIEAKILFDADKLDGLGPFGILRVFALARQVGRSLPDTIHWYRTNIAVAMPSMQTPEGRAIMERKLPLVQTFLFDLEAELDI